MDSDAASLPNSNLRRAQRVQLEAECTSLKEQTRKLEIEFKKQREILTANLTAKELEWSHLAPVYTLPDDVWFEILETAFAHHFPRCEDPQSTSPDSSIIFSHVSRRFREVALAFPNIWTCVHINPDQHPLYSNLLQEQLRRSKNSPISITFICRGPSHETTPMLDPESFPSHEFTAHFEACWKLLLKHARRWRHLSFWAEHKQIVERLLHNSDTSKKGGVSFPQLEYMDICTGSEKLHDEPSCFHIRPIIQDTPKLSALRLRDAFPSTLSSMTLTSITRLTLVQTDVKLSKLECTLMAMAGTLSALFMDTVNLSEISVNNIITSLHLPRLRHLLLNDVHPFNIFARRFSSGAPNLLELEIGASPPTDDPSVRSIRSTPIFPKLKRLHLVSFGDPVRIPLFEPTLLEIFPALEHVIIREGTPSLAPLFTLACLEAKYQSLNKKTATNRSLPPLKKIWISDLGYREVVNKLAQMITRMATLGCPLEEAVLLQQYDSAVAGDDKWRASEYQPEGDEDIDEVPSIIRYEENKWYDEEGARFLEWECAYDCPTLPFWMRRDEAY